MKLFNVSIPGYGVHNEIWVAGSIDALAQALFGDLVTDIERLSGDRYRLRIRAGSGFYFVFIEGAEIKLGRAFSIIE